MSERVAVLGAGRIGRQIALAFALGGAHVVLVDLKTRSVADAERVLAAVPGGCRQLLYARVDLAPDESGNPVLMELELTEPQLFLGTDDGAADRLAEAIAAKVGSLAMSNGRRSVRWAG